MQQTTRERQQMNEQTITGPFYNGSKADKPRFTVIVKRGDYIDHHHFEGTDASTSGLAEVEQRAADFAAKAARGAA
jgi:hypothetical protein